VLGDPTLPTPADLERAFRFPDVSVVIDASHVPHQRKLEFLATLLPSLAALRAAGGLPHRVVIDEAHYFLDDDAVAAQLDFASGGYTCVTYRPSELAPAVLAAAGPVVATRHTDPRDVAILSRFCGQDLAPERLGATLRSLSVSEAVLLPSAAEAGGALVRFHVAPRLTPHVRHRHKYADLPIPASRAFVFTAAPGRPAAGSLAGFTAMLEQLETAAIARHLHHHDFSRWLADVFGDHALARDVADIEGAFATGAAADPIGAVAAAIRARYDVKRAPAPT
jgi:hypothetical protein